MNLTVQEAETYGVRGGSPESRVKALLYAKHKFNELAASIIRLTP